jgi:hypothetical protein
MKLSKRLASAAERPSSWDIPGLLREAADVVARAEVVTTAPTAALGTVCGTAIAMEAAKRGNEIGVIQGDPYPWIVVANGQCWGLFATNEEAVAWATAAGLDTCDFEDVMPPAQVDSALARSRQEFRDLAAMQGHSIGVHAANEQSIKALRLARVYIVYTPASPDRDKSSVIDAIDAALKASAQFNAQFHSQ